MSALPILSVREAAEYLGVSTKYLRRRVTDGHLAAFRLSDGANGRLRFYREDLDALLVPVPTAAVSLHGGGQA